MSDQGPPDGLLEAFDALAGLCVRLNASPQQTADIMRLATATYVYGLNENLRRA